MTRESWQIGISIAWVMIFVLFAFSARRRGLERRLSQAFVVYAFLAMVWELAQIAFITERLSAYQTLALRLRWMEVLSLALMFLAVSWFFLQIEVTIQRAIGFGMGTFLLLICLVLFFNPTKLAVNLQSVLFSSCALGGWLIVLGDTIYKTISSYRRVHKPQHRNRMIYWGLAVIIIAFGNFISLTRSDFSGNVLHLIGTLLAGYVILIHEAVDLGRVLVRLVSYGAITVIGGIIYVLVLDFPLAQLGVDAFSTEQVVWVLKSLLLLTVVNPILIFIYNRLDQKILGRNYDRSEVVREYGLRVSNLADLHVLAREAIGFIDETFHIEFGHLFLVNMQAEAKTFYLEPVAVEGASRVGLAPVTFAFENPIARHVIETKRPFTQYDIDFLPRFRGLSAEEKAWFTQLQADLFLPICTKDEWIGLFVLGSKKSGSRYTKDDIDLLTTLANQTVAALQNARLVTDVQAASQALEAANKRLREVDELKSAFIGVITHEMRTPLANIVFAMQILEKYGTNNLTAEQLKQLVQVSKGVKAARNMIDNLILHASFLNNQVVLKTEQFDFFDLLSQVLEPMAKLAAEKELRLSLDVAEGDMQVMADRALLGVALYHLVDNAIKFTDPGGKIWIGAWSAAEAIWVDVRDTGRGIPPEKVGMIWQSFAQASADSLRRGMEGLGLGLSLVKFIVSAHGGQVGVESEPGVGSIFRFAIPRYGPAIPLESSLKDLFHNPFVDQALPPLE